MSLELSVNTEQKIQVTINPAKPGGGAAKLDGVPEWSVLSGPATVVPAEDGLSAYLVSSDTDLEDTVFQVDADADLGEGVVTISDTITLHTTGVQATSLGLTAGEPEPK